MKRFAGFLALTALLVPMVLTGCSGQDKVPTVTVYWALYDGLTEEFRAEVEEAFNSTHEDVQVEIVPVKWDSLLDKLTTSIAAGSPPDLSVVGTRWLLEFMDMDAVEEITPYVSQSTLDNISPGAMEAKIGGKLMGLPVAAGARILVINKSLTEKVPSSMEELRREAVKVTEGTDKYGLVMVGKKHTELTDFAYYFYGAGGSFFEMKNDGSFGKCTVNSDAGIKALSFMNELANKDKVVQDGFLSLDRYTSHPIFYSGDAAYCMIGAWAESELQSSNADFEWEYAQIPGFEGHGSTPLIITDSIALFKDSKNKEAAGMFLDFFYQDQWKAKFDEMVGFPPVTISASKLPQFQTPIYKALGEAAMNAKGWPLMEGWAEYSDIIWDAVQFVYLGEKDPKEALDDAAVQIDRIRGM